MSPDYPAKKSNYETADRPAVFHLAGFGLAAHDVTRPVSSVIEEEPFEDDMSGAAMEIATLFGRKLAGLRRLPRAERPHALRAAREWRRMALKALNEKRATARYARFMLRRLRKLEAFEL